MIEAFLREPQLHLSICSLGLLENDPFWRIYGPDIRKADNISFHGAVDPLGGEFRKITASTGTVVFPSASENGGGGVVQCLHHGLIPLVTEITGLEIFNTWPPLTGNTDVQFIEGIQLRCREIAEMPEQQLSEWSHFFWEYAHKYHTRNSYSQSLSDLLNELLIC